MGKAVFVLMDTSDHMIYGVVTDEGAAEDWVGFDPQYTALEMELNDFTAYNEVRDALGLDEDGEAEPAYAERDDED